MELLLLLLLLSLLLLRVLIEHIISVVLHLDHFGK